jgi:hypothetical protein
VKTQNNGKETVRINVRFGGEIKVGSKIRKWLLLILGMVLSLIADLNFASATRNMNAQRPPIENERMLGHQRPTASPFRPHKRGHHREAEPGRCRDTGTQRAFTLR